MYLSFKSGRYLIYTNLILIYYLKYLSLEIKKTMCINSSACILTLSSLKINPTTIFNRLHPTRQHGTHPAPCTQTPLSHKPQRLQGSADSSLRMTPPSMQQRAAPYTYALQSGRLHDEVTESMVTASMEGRGA
jgi:hypothetical protein